MLEQILNGECCKIDQKAELEKNKVKYIINLIEKNYQEFCNVFNNEIEKSFNEKVKVAKENEEYDQLKKHFFKSELYHKTKQMVDKLDKEAIQIIGITLYKKEEISPPIKLGLCEYYKPKGLKISLRKLTEKGISVINKYRDIQGLSPIRETRERADKMLMNLIQQK